MMIQISVKQNKEKHYIFVLGINNFITYNKDKGTRKQYSYQDVKNTYLSKLSFQVESLRPMDNKQYCFKLKFYKKDGNFKIPQKEFNFTCKDSEAFFTV